MAKKAEMSLNDFVALFAMDWVMTLFSRAFTGRMDVIGFLWDMFLLKGWPFYYSICLAMLKWTESLLLACDTFEDLAKEFMNIGRCFSNAELIMVSALEFKMTDKSIGKG